MRSRAWRRNREIRVVRPVGVKAVVSGSRRGCGRNRWRGYLVHSSLIVKCVRVTYLRRWRWPRDLPWRRKACVVRRVGWVVMELVVVVRPLVVSLLAFGFWRHIFFVFDYLEKEESRGHKKRCSPFLHHTDKNVSSFNFWLLRQSLLTHVNALPNQTFFIFCLTNNNSSQVSTHKKVVQ